MRKKFTILIAALALLTMIVQPMRAWAQDYTYTLASGDFTANTHSHTSGSYTWTHAHGSGTESYGWDDTYGFKFGSGNSSYPSGFTLTSSSVSSKIKKVVVTASVNSKKSCNLDVKVGSTTYGSQVTINTKNNDEWEFSIADASTVNGAVQLSFSSNNGPLYLKKIEIYYYTSGGGSTSSITIDGEGITNNAISLPYNNTSDHTATVTATGLGDNPDLTLGRFTDSGCTTAYSGSDFTASLSGTTITYGFANANTSHTTPRTFYMRVSSGTTNSNVITVTQGAAPYTVTFNVDGGTFVGNTPFPSSTTSIAAGTYALPSATKDNWNFGGWKLDGTETILQAGANYTVSDNVSFTAQWVLSKTAVYTVTSTSEVSTSGIIPTNSSATYSSTYSSKYQLTAGNSMTLTLSGYAGQRITGVTLSMRSNKDAGAGYLTITGGTTPIKTIGSSNSGVAFSDPKWNGSYTTSYVPVNVLTNGIYAMQTNENLVIVIGCTTNSLYCQSFSITYQDASIPVLAADDLELAYSATSGEITYQKLGTGSGTVAANTTADWISNVAVDETNSKVTFDCTENAGAERTATVTITWGELSKEVTVTQAGLPCTVTYDANGGSGSMTDENSPYSYGETVTVKANSFTHTTLTFDSWNTAANGSGTSYTPNSTFTITSNVTLYAQWRGNHTYSLVSSSADLKTGKHYIIVGKKEADSVFYAMGSQGTNVRNAVAVSINAGAITEVNGIREFVISGDATNKWTIYDKMNPGYLYASGGNGNNYINTRANNEDANSQWAISFDNDTAYIVAQGTANRNEIRFNYNSGNSRFSCYSSTSSLKTKAYIFVRNEDKDYEFYSNTTLASATIANDETYTVHKPAVFEVTGTLTSLDPARLVIEDGAQMKISNNGVYATVKKFIPGYGAGNEDAKAGYRLITQPLDYTLLRSGNPGDPLIENTGMLTGKFDFYKWDYTKDQEEWRNYEATGSDFNMNNNLYGYLYANESDVELNFAGPLRNNTSSNERYLTIEGTHAFNGWYLMGNSFVCNGYLVSAETDGTPLPYYRMNDDGDGFTAVSNGAAIAPMEGIFYQTIQDKTVYMVTTAPTPSEVGNGNLNITLAQTVTNRGEKGDTDNAIIRFDGGNTLEKFSFSDNTAKIYIPQDGKDYAVVSAEARGEMPVNFKAAKNGTYTISVETENLEVSYLHLIDNMTGENVDLLQTPSYTFTGKTSDYASRFRLVFNANNLNENDSDEPFAFISNDNIVVMNEGEATLQVIDMLGRVIETKTLNGNATIGTQANGVYVLRLINGDNVKTQKIVVK